MNEKRRIVSGFEETEGCFVGGAFIIDEPDNNGLGEIDDYDCGILNDYGGGNVQWWQDYIRSEIQRCNEYWREALKEGK